MLLSTMSARLQAAVVVVARWLWTNQAKSGPPVGSHTLTH